jgi:hypothetical protein
MRLPSNESVNTLRIKRLLAERLTVRMIGPRCVAVAARQLRRKRRNLPHSTAADILGSVRLHPSASAL